MDEFDDAFEAMFQNQLTHGGLDAPAIDERVEREYRMLDRHKRRRCPHGRTLLTCTECYFTTGWGEK